MAKLQNSDKLRELQQTNRAYWMEEAFAAANDSTCMRPECRIGAVAVLNGKVVSRGFNGPSKEFPSCAKRGFCIRQKLNIQSGTQREVAYCICAEQRMICDAARKAIQLKGAEVYVTHMPCATCVRLMLETGIARVFYHLDYPNQFTMELCSQANFELIKI
jgi:dCMP deaminase